MDDAREKRMQLKSDIVDFKPLTDDNWNLIKKMDKYELYDLIFLYDRCTSFIYDLILSDISNNSDSNSPRTLRNLMIRTKK